MNSVALAVMALVLAVFAQPADCQFILGPRGGSYTLSKSGNKRVAAAVATGKAPLLQGDCERGIFEVPRGAAWRVLYPHGKWREAVR